MKRLEIIHLRSSGEAIESLGERITESIPAGDKNHEIVTLYRRNGLVTDFAIHIHHHDAAGETAPCVLSLHLANALRAFGLVEHTVWEEMQPQKAKDRVERATGSTP